MKKKCVLFNFKKHAQVQRKQHLRRLGLINTAKQLEIDHRWTDRPVTVGSLLETTLFVFVSFF